MRQISPVALVQFIKLSQMCSCFILLNAPILSACDVRTKVKAADRVCSGPDSEKQLKSLFVYWVYSVRQTWEPMGFVAGCPGRSYFEGATDFC